MGERRRRRVRAAVSIGVTGVTRERKGESRGPMETQRERIESGSLYGGAGGSSGEERMQETGEGERSFMRSMIKKKEKKRRKKKRKKGGWKALAISYSLLKCHSSSLASCFLPFSMGH